jgi:pSer/pThr/pTyr-binding forkhead associated (FHA) protein
MRKLRVSGRHGDREVPLEGTVVAGRDARCDIADDDPMLSRRHAEFVVTAHGTIVRDLQSRNGIRVNGAKLTESLLRPGDVVEMADLRIVLVDDAVSDATRETVTDDDRTVVVTPGASATGARASGGSAAGPALEDDGRTVILPKSAPAASASPAAAAAQPAAAIGTPVKPRTPRPSRSWGGRTLLTMLALAMLVFLVTALPMLMWHRRVVDDAAVARAEALAQWLAADAGASLRAGGKGAGDAGAAVAREPGVVAYVIMSPQGEVRAPAARVGQTIATLPGIGEPSQVLRLRSGWNGDQVEVALPVASVDNPRAAIAALSFRPSATPGETSSASVLIPVLLASLILGWLAAFRLRRSTIGSLAAFNEDVDLVLAGQLPAVTDPLGTPPTSTLAQTVNYLASRVRAGDRGDAAKPVPEAGGAAPARAPVTPRRAAAPASAEPPTGRTERGTAAASPAPPSAAGAGSPVRSARLIASPAFKIEQASPECRELIGVASDRLAGQHLLDAIPDKVILDGILKCLSRLSAGGEERMTVHPEGKPYRVAITVERAARDQPITITLAQDGPAA